MKRMNNAPVYLALVLACNGVAMMRCQADEEQKPVEIPKIADGPVAIDPATLVPAKIAQKVTVEFSQAALSEVGQWIEQTAGLPVLFDKAALESAGISLSEPVSDQLTNDALYLLLNRLRTLGVAWYLQDDVVRVTTIRGAAKQSSTSPYTLSELLDQEFESEDLMTAISESLGGKWQDTDGEGGSVELLGDVLFVRQTNDLHLQIKGLLAALQKHGKQTYIFDPLQHQKLRSQLLKNVTVDFDDTPLIEAVQQLSDQSGVDIRLDVTELRKSRIRDRQPVTLSLAERQLSTVLDVLLAEAKLTWMIRDGILWVTSQDRAAEELVTAVYDVRDLCRDYDESMALQEAIYSQIGSRWLDIDGDGGTITFAKAGTMIVHHTDRLQGNLLRLLTAYRTALKTSKPRQNKTDPETEVLTRYYSVQTAVAPGLLKFIQTAVKPASWKSDANPEAKGVVEQILPAGLSILRNKTSSKTTSEAVVVDRTVLVITQTRAQHRIISDIIRRVENGDERPLDPGLGAGGGLGGGGFGGGFFSIQDQKEARQESR